MRVISPSLWQVSLSKKGRDTLDAKTSHRSNQLYPWLTNEHLLGLSRPRSERDRRRRTTGSPFLSKEKEMRSLARSCETMARTRPSLRTGAGVARGTDLHEHSALRDSCRRHLRGLHSALLEDFRDQLRLVGRLENANGLIRSRTIKFLQCRRMSGHSDASRRSCPTTSSGATTMTSTVRKKSLT